MNVSTVLPSITSQLTEREWDKLINLILEGCVVPVVGPELLISGEPGQESPLYNLWGRTLADQTGLAVPNGDSASTLYRVTNELSQKENLGDLASDIDSVLRDTRWPVPGALRKLAEILSFSLYVTTSIDHLLKNALEEARASQHQRIEEIIFTPHGAKTRTDLPGDFTDSHMLGLFYLFGASSKVAGDFAKNEDDMIEYSWSLLDQQYAPQRLYDYLQQKAVLLLGCNFPDWLGRFFIHALHGGALPAARHEETINIYYISAHCDAGLADYLKRRRAHVLTEQSPVAFVDELHKRWRSRYKRPDSGEPEGKSPDAPPAFKRGAVFLSYASEDRATVREIRDQLEAAHIDTWMDERGLEPGEEYQRVIRENIEDASFFIAIVSRSLDRTGAKGRFVFREWKWAERASEVRHKDDCFLQAVVIDDTPSSASFVDAPYRDLHWTRLRDGGLPQEFIEVLSRGIRNYRRSR
ncbi:MAG: toll/interleukin-1 receptor domain-containing protein [Acidobacteriia bacterium]|nr:toll/interleukin-1 receptor domain-containing protein [Terriglobia bacterium]